MIKPMTSNTINAVYKIVPEICEGEKCFSLYRYVKGDWRFICSEETRKDAEYALEFLKQEVTYYD